MLDRSRQIDWALLGYHVYGKPETIPDSLRRLLSPDPEVREQARGFLLGEGQDFGDVYDTTPYIIPFLFEILASKDAPGKVELIDHMTGVGEYILRSHHLSIHMMNLCIHTYSALSAGKTILLGLLTSEQAAVRAVSARLLKYLTDDHSVISDLFDHFEQETDEEVQVEVMKALKTLFHALEWPHAGIRKTFAPRVNAVVENHPSKKARIAAARAAVELYAPYSWDSKVVTLSPRVGEVLIEEFFERAGSIDPDDESFARFDEMETVKDLSLLDPKYLLDLLKDPQLTPEQAHTVTRGLLVNLFSRQHHDWEKINNFLSRQEGLYYSNDIDGLSSLRIRPFFERHMPVFKAIVDTDAVWEIPTNLFSYFFSLPDTREDFRRAIQDPPS